MNALDRISTYVPGTVSRHKFPKNPTGHTPNPCEDTLLLVIFHRKSRYTTERRETCLLVFRHYLIFPMQQQFSRLALKFTTVLT
jgi:hypothetical protein